MKRKILSLVMISVFATITPARAEDAAVVEKIRKWREMKAHRAEGRDKVLAAPEASLSRDFFENRDILLHIAPNAPAPGNRAMVIVLHGGMGNAAHIQSIIGDDMDNAADEGGFIVAYLNGTRATEKLKNQYHAWNAGGGCCGLPYRSNIDDVGYVTRAVKYLSNKYGVDPRKLFVMGHSNGAMLTQRLMCETDIFQAAIPVSGPLNTESSSCPAAKGKRIWAIHGAEDRNVPIAGGRGTQGVTNIDYKSQARTQKIFEESGARYTLDIVDGADHGLDHVAQAVAHRDGRTFGQDAALFFGLAPK